MTRNRDGRVPPHNLDAEQSTLGACLLSAAARDDVMPLLAPSDFYRPAHQHVWEHIRRIHGLGKPIDVVIVAESLRFAGLLDEVGGMEFLNGLVAFPPAISNADRYAEVVLATSQQRKLIMISTEIAESGFGEAPVGETIAVAKAKLDEVDLAGRTEVSVVRGEHALAIPPAPYDWVQDQIVERDDRLLLTGGEGSGKSMLLLQWAVMTAAGRHWWTQSAVPPKRALVIDMELGMKRTRRRIELFHSEATWGNEEWFKNLVVYSKSDDIDITTRAGASFLASIFDAAQPDIAFIGPIYRLVSGVAKAGDIGGEDQAKRAAFALDKIRERFNCAIVAETHAAKGEAGRGRDLRPFGSATWLRWPEFGYGLVRQSPDATGFHLNTREFVNWRGDRDPRDWPDRFVQMDTGWRMKAEYDNTPVWWHALQTGQRSTKAAPSGPHIDPHALEGF